MDIAIYLAVAVCVMIMLAVILVLRNRAQASSAAKLAQLSAKKLDPRESELDQSIQTVRRILLQLADAIRGAHKATGNSNSTLVTARDQISKIRISPEFADAQQALLKEIDRVTHANSELQIELANSQQALMEQKAELDKLRTAVRIDALTGLGNRAYFEEHLNEALEKLRRHQEIFSLMMIDIDHFKKVNDTYGHVTGDRILSGLADRFKATVRATDFKARYGGEEFAIISHKSDESMAKTMAQSLRSEIASHKFRVAGKDNPPITITISIGVAGAREDDSPTTLVERADKALYRAKQEGRNKVCRAGELKTEPPAKDNEKNVDK